jgi:hypothetical protein
MARLRDEFGWPHEHLIFESPTLVRNGTVVLGTSGLDILLLESPRTEPAAKMTIDEARSRLAVEVKADAKLLGKLLDRMRARQAADAAIPHTNHASCLAIAELRPPLFLAVAANETWRLFNVVERDGRAVLGDELPDLDRLQFSSS